MNRRRAALIGLVVTVALSRDARSVLAGSFLIPQQCQVVSTDPPRYRPRFLLSDHHRFGPLCDVRLDPMSFDGSLIRPALAGSAPSALTFSIEASGSAHWTANPCLAEPWFFSADSLYVIVDGVPASFAAYLITTGGAVAHAHNTSWPCANPVDVGSGEPPRQLWLGAFAPNPARTSTALPFSLPREGRVRIAIYDIPGRRMRTVVEGSSPAGWHQAAWDLRDEQGHEAPSGLYVARLEAEGTVLTRRLIRTR
ncbi:MAG: FlgD immunoglobulin-like domain containing protein [Candidatus Eiseniibacteriota bacterium]